MGGAFRLVALPKERFAAFFALSEAELRSRGARRMVVDDKPGYPCRVSLADAEIGETVVLLPFMHHDVETPYRAGGPIFVRERAETATPGVGEVPVMFRHRLLSLRGYTAEGMMAAAKVSPGAELEAAIAGLFVEREVAYLHVHNAGPGCFNCRVERM
ncbi:MAG: hypothetical protein AMXMBFR47_03430 [Planctomycetota bacterium]